MKKILTLLIASLALYACGDEYTTYEGVTLDYAYYTVEPRDWRAEESEALGSYYFCQIKEPKLDRDIFRYGFVNAYLALNIGGVDVLYPLPFDDFYVDSEDPNYFWAEQVTAEFAPGHVTFILKYSDQRNDVGVPDFNYDFKVVFGRNPF